MDTTLRKKLEIIEKEIENTLTELDAMNKNIFCLISHFGKIQL